MMFIGTLVEIHWIFLVLSTFYEFFVCLFPSTVCYTKKKYKNLHNKVRGMKGRQLYYEYYINHRECTVLLLLQIQ